MGRPPLTISNFREYRPCSHVTVLSSHRPRSTFIQAGKLRQNLSKQPINNAKDHRPHQQRYGQHGEIVSKSSGHPPTLPASRHRTAAAVELLDADQAAGSSLSIKRLNRKPFADFTRPKTGLPAFPSTNERTHPRSNPDRGQEAISASAGEWRQGEKGRGQTVATESAHALSETMSDNAPVPAVIRPHLSQLFRAVLHRLQ
jgi:hypothetical protein